MLSSSTMTVLYWALGAIAVAFVAVRLLKHFRFWPGMTRRPAAVPPPVAVETSSAEPAAGRRVSWESRRLFAREAGPEEASAVRAIGADEVPAYDTSDYVAGRATPALAEMLPDSPESRKQWKRDLRTAGFLSPRAWQNFAAVRYLLVAGSMLLLGLALVLVPRQLELPVLIALVVVPLLCWAVPALYVRSRIADRRNRIEAGMPDFVDMLNMCVSQGLTLTSSFRRISRQLAEPYPELATEIGIVLEQAEIGSLRQALENFADRVDSPAVNSLTTLLIQTDRMGTSVSDALREYSDGVRESQRQRADERANRASFRLLFPTVLCLMPAVYLILLGPAVNELNRFFNAPDGGRALIQQGQQQARDLSQ